MAHLPVIDIEALADEVTEDWVNMDLTQVNEALVRLAVVRGEYHWHTHPDEDEFFFVYLGRFLVHTEDETIDLRPGQGVMVPRGVRHKTSAPIRSLVLLFERASLVSAGE